MKSRFLSLFFVYLAIVFPMASTGIAQQTPGDTLLRVVISDANGLPVPGAICTLFASTDTKNPIATITTDDHGTAQFNSIAAVSLSLNVEKTGFQILSKNDIQITLNQITEIKLTLAISSLQADVTVTAQSDAATTVEAGASTPTGNLKRESLTKTPLASSKIVDALPLIPGVIRSATGEISMKGASEQQNNLLVNGLNASDPATGNFRLNLPVDSVEAVQVFQHPYTAQYGGFIGGVTGVQTRRGGEEWHFD